MNERLGEILTFYSYKGGVGRSMAAANVAVVHALRGRRVLVIDFDLEAPGLHRYFLTSDSRFGEQRFSPRSERAGVIEFFDELRARLDAILTPAIDEVAVDTSHVVAVAASAIIPALLESGEYLYEVRVSGAGSEAPQGKLSFMPAGRLDEGYAERVRGFDWRMFYSRFGALFPVLIEELKRQFDIVIIDSRTGIVDTAGICTMLLPDKLVLVFVPNEQSLHGAVEIGRQALAARSATDRQLVLFPIISKLDDGEEELKRRWVDRAKDAFTKMFRHSGRDIRLDAYFDVSRIPYRSHFAYGETIAVEHQLATEIGSLAQVYAGIDGVLLAADILDVERLVAEHRRRTLGEHEFGEYVSAMIRAIQKNPDVRSQVVSMFGKMVEMWGILKHQDSNRLEIALQFERLGDALAAVGQTENARDAYQRALAIAEVAAAPDDPVVVRLREHLSSAR